MFMPAYACFFTCAYVHKTLYLYVCERATVFVAPSVLLLLAKGLERLYIIGGARTLGVSFMFGSVNPRAVLPNTGGWGVPVYTRG